ncbi:MBL fold metallo-hydrolase [Halomarina litorea]|uniref:MBL fold metallo-hydrolase n=1 Tax=Halomarina litorea TaxID=2961595 RepID=UPI0020C35031|nr:MBL fold metallo-hydrolase [Halomarina sp. BCD28]
MAIGDLHHVESGNCEDLYYVDVGLFDTPEYGSVYLLDAERPAVVDTGTGANYEVVLDGLAELGVAPEDLAAIAVTHVHLDHAGGAGYLARECENASVVVYERGARHLADPSRLVAGTKQVVGDRWRHYADPLPIDEDRMTVVDDGDVVDLGDHQLEVHRAPGHAPHQVVFFDPANDAVFTADAAGIYVPSQDTVEPTTPPVNFDLDQSLADVEMLRSLDPEVLLYGHFGDAPAAARLTEYAETLSAWVEEIRAVRERLGDDEAVVEHFVERTEMADAWGDEQARIEAELNVRGVLVALDREK